MTRPAATCLDAGPGGVSQHDDKFESKWIHKLPHSDHIGQIRVLCMPDVVRRVTMSFNNLNVWDLVGGDGGVWHCPYTSDG